MADNTLNIAVVGGGIAGCSAAWFLRQALGKRASLTVFESSDRVGGRLATVRVGGVEVEAGGTIIHETNQYMAGFVESLGLDRVEPHQLGERGSTSDRGGGDGVEQTVGVWNGERLVFRTHQSQLLTRLAAVLRYGVAAPLRMQRAVSSLVEQWNRVYDDLEDGRGFESPAHMLAELGLGEMLTTGGRQWLGDNGVRDRFIDEYATPVGRIMYGQDVSMQAVAVSIALAGAGLAGKLFSVSGGNHLVCEGLLREAGVTPRTGTTVERLKRVGESSDTPGGYTLQLASENSALGKSEGSQPAHFDLVLLATPGGPTAVNIAGVELSSAVLRKRPMQVTWATFVSGTPRPEYFGEKNVGRLPDTLLTVEDDTIPFSSLGLVGADDNGNGIYKLFSRQQPGDALLDELFADRRATERLRWEAYPVLSPAEDLPPFRLERGLYWVNAMEFATSTMETEAVAARNVANLVATDF